MILRTLEEFKRAVPTAAGVEDFDDLLTYVETAETWLSRNVLGSRLYNAISEEIDDGVVEGEGTGSSEILSTFELLRLCHVIIANHAYWDAIPFLDVIHTNAGFGVIQAQGKAPASKERIERLRAQCIVRRDAAVDDLMAYLMENSQYESLWQSDSIFDTIYGSLLPTLEIFRKYNNIADRATLDKLRPAIIAVQNTIIADAISQDFVDELVEAQKDNDFTAEHNNIIGMLRDAIAKLSIAHGVDDLSVVVDSTGILRAYQIGVSSYADEARLSLYKETYHRTGKKLLEKVVDYINENIDDYPTYFASPEYTAKISSGWENDEDYTVFSSIPI